MLYGTTGLAGHHGSGTLFHLAPSSCGCTLKILQEFDYRGSLGPTAGAPHSGPTLLPNGALIGAGELQPLLL